MKKFLTVILNLFLLTTFASAADTDKCIDKDKDGYIVHDDCKPLSEFKGCITDFNEYKKEATACTGVKFKKGLEPEECDAAIINDDDETGLYDTTKINGPLKGSIFNPGQPDIPKNGMDENCDGADEGGGGGVDFPAMVKKVISFLSTLSMGVSIIVLVGGGIMYSTAAGNDEKTSKARKAMIGALIGALIAFFAPSIVGFVIDQLG